MSAQSLSMNAFPDGGFLLTVFVESFADRSKSPFGTALSLLLAKDDLILQLVMARMIRKFTSQQVLRLTGETVSRSV